MRADRDPARLRSGSSAGVDREDVVVTPQEGWKGWPDRLQLPRIVKNSITAVASIFVNGVKLSALIVGGWIRQLERSLHFCGTVQIGRVLFTCQITSRGSDRVGGDPTSTRDI